MPTITVERELYQELEAVAQARQTNTNDVAQEALQLFLWKEGQRKIAQESATYRQQHPELKRQYLGHYIAMHHGQVVDHDPEFQSLFERVRCTYGQTPIMITLVQEEAETVLQRRGFRYEQ